MLKIITVFALLAGLAACASNSDMDALRRDIDNLQRSSFESKKELDGLKERTAKVVREDSFNALRESQADLTTRMTDMASSLQELRGRFDESKYYQEKIMKESASEKDLLRAQMTALEAQMKSLRERLASAEDLTKDKGQQAQTAEKPEGADKPDPGQTAVQPEAGSTADDATRLYGTAYQLFTDKKFKEAREKFEGFVKEYPKHKLSGNAQFWIAETFYSEKDYESAILAYETLLKKYPDSEKTSGALLKQGYAFAEIGDNKTARAILEKLLHKYPDSKDAAQAKKRISELEKRPGKKK